MGEETKELLKKVLILGVVVLIIIIGALVYKIMGQNKGPAISKQYAIFGNYLIWQKTSTGYHQIKELNDEMLSLQYNVTDGNDETNNVTLQFLNNQWYVMDSEYQQVDGKVRLATHKLDITLGEYSRVLQNDISQEAELLNFFQTKNINYKQGYYAEKVIFDFDQDGTDETIYTISNSSLSAEKYAINSFIVMLKNGAIEEIASQQHMPYNIMEIADMDGDGLYEIIVSTDVLNLPSFKSCYRLYRLVDGHWQLQQDCE